MSQKLLTQGAVILLCLIHNRNLYWGFEVKQRLVVRKQISNDRICKHSLHSLRSSSINGAGSGSEEEMTADCPFSMPFSKYRVPLSSSSASYTRKPLPMEQDDGILGLFSTSLQRVQRSIIDRNIIRQSETKYGSTVQWIELEDAGSSSRTAERNIYAYVKFWKAVLSLASSTSAQQPVLLAFPQLSHITVTRIQEIYSWYKDWQLNTAGENKKSLRFVHVEKISTSGSPFSLVPQLLLTPCTQTPSATLSHATEADSTSIGEEENMTKVINKRIKSWVRRVLVRYEICPFTKSDARSGHGLTELGIPVAKIAYHTSFSTQIPELMYDTWLAIYQMISAGPNNISSILLAAPAFDNKFPLWAGPIFAVLEASVSALEAEASVGVVCFHPHYKIPNEKSSWPGFGQMHSISKLRSFLMSSSSRDNNSLLSRRDIAAGGAWQRRTPHATINVLRADQLQAAEGRRHTPSLYARNIEYLIRTVGLQKLEEDLKHEQQLDS